MRDVDEARFTHLAGCAGVAVLPDVAHCFGHKKSDPCMVQLGPMLVHGTGMNRTTHAAANAALC